MSLLGKIFGAGDGAKPVDFDAFVTGALEGLRLQTEGHSAMWKLGEEQNWEFDQDTGLLVFTFADAIAQAQAQIIGTFDRESQTWLWAWANDSIDEPLRRDALRVREFGEKNGIERLTTRKWAGEESDGWKMAAVANRVCGTNGAYRAPAGPALVFMTFGEIKLGRRA